VREWSKMKDYEDLDKIELYVLHRIRWRWKLRPREISDKELYDQVKHTLFFQFGVLGEHMRILRQIIRVKFQNIMLKIGGFIKR